jgi:neutral ceramidase
MKNIKTGTAIVNIDLPVGLDMTGYLLRTSNSKGIHDELKIRGIVFDNGIEKFALIVCDLLGLDVDFIKAVTGLIEKYSSIPANNIVISCIHTHSGPASLFLQDCGEVDEKWMSTLKNKIVECLLQAKDRVKPSLLDFKNGICNIGMNRVLGNNEDVDPQVSVLTIRNAETGFVDTIIVNYGCHPVVLGPDNLLYSKDYPHYLEVALKESYGDDVNIIFANGCLGDINPIDMDSFKKAEKIGRKLSESIMAIDSQTLTHRDFNGSRISVVNTGVTIPLKLDVNNFEKQRAALQEELNKEISKNGDSITAKIYRAHIHWTERMLDKIKKKTFYHSIKADLKLIKIGPLVILALPFEVFHDIGFRLKEYFGKYNTMVVGLANGAFGYLPSRALYSAAMYETGDAYKYYGYPGPVCEDAEDIVFDALINTIINL